MTNPSGWERNKKWIILWAVLLHGNSGAGLSLAIGGAFYLYLKYRPDRSAVRYFVRLWLWVQCGWVVGLPVVVAVLIMLRGHSDLTNDLAEDWIAHVSILILAGCLRLAFYRKLRRLANSSTASPMPAIQVPGSGE